MTYEDIPGLSEDGSPNSPCCAAGLLVERLREARTAGASERRTAELKALQGLVKSGEIRDWPFTGEVYQEFFAFQAVALTWGRSAQLDGELARQIFLGMVRVPEFDAKAADRYIQDDFVMALASKTDGTHPQEEWPYLRDVLLWLYEHSVARRAQLRSLVGRVLRAFSKFSHRNVPVAPLLQVLGPIIRGFRAPLTQEHKSLLLEVLLPLHRPNEWLQWDRQTPLISMYHKELVHCIKLYLEKQPSLSVRCLEAICTHFPQDREANTPKEVLLLHEISQVLRFVDAEGIKQVLPPLLRHMVRLLGSHNAQPIQSVLQFWKDEHIERLFQGAARLIVPQLLPVLLRSGEPFWNPTVNRMTSLVLEKMEQGSPELFAEVAEDLWGPGRGVPAFELAQVAEARPEPEEQPEEDAAQRPHPPPPNVASLKFRMGDWKPPSGSSSGSGSGGQPPVTVTGVAPWAVQGGAGALRPGPLSNAQASNGSQKQPPLTTTGVAPWAFKGQPPKAGPLGGGLGAGPPRPRKPPPKSSLGAFREEDEEKGEDGNAAASSKSGIERVRAYMKVLCPLVSQDGKGQPWEAAQMAESPTLLPTLKFHNLVFGHEDLGTGAFSVVRYARTIDKDTTQSKWAEYAVKIINTKTMEDLGYEASVNREICVLRMLSHPGIARMVSSFRWRDGAYLVLEYAARGDLHSILVRLGKFEEATVRFFLGEIVAALNAIHQIGFVYGDLKPENIVITGTCHAKLTDFGGCRPLTAEARERTQRSLLRSLRDGDWRAADAGGENAEEPPQADGAAQVEDDGRVEGTTMYLPPEVVRGATPTFAADAWALGCVEYQLLTGRPPIWVDSEREEDLRSRIVSFTLESADEAMGSLSEAARGLASRLLEQDAERRLSVMGAAGDAFFEGTDVFTLYKKARGPELPVIDKAAPAGDERWQKRQFSKIWTVMPSPQDYVVPDTFSDQVACTQIVETDAECNAPFSEDGWSPTMAGDNSQIQSL